MFSGGLNFLLNFLDVFIERGGFRFPSVPFAQRHIFREYLPFDARSLVLEMRQPLAIVRIQRADGLLDGAPRRDPVVSSLASASPHPAMMPQTIWYLAVYAEGNERSARRKVVCPAVGGGDRTCIFHI
jgi:hypothetical protein